MLAALAAANAVWSFLKSPIGIAVSIILAITIAFWSGYAKGRISEYHLLKAKIERQANEQIEKGNSGRADALRGLDAGGVPDIWLRD